MGNVHSGYDSWLCTFCSTVAIRETKEHVLCDTRTGSCGATALAAPVFDTDEIIDDALQTFGVQIREKSRGFDAIMLEDLRLAGVEIREGQPTRVREGFSGEYASLWFRKSAGPASA
jgi:hypothetical protein